MKHSDGGTGSSSCALPASHHGRGLRCPRCTLSPPPRLGALPSLAVERLKFHCYKKKKNIPNKHTFLSRQFLFCLVSVNATSCTGSCSDPPGQRSESTAIRGWQHLHSLFYPGRSEQMLEMEGISSQIPVFTAQLAWSEGNPWIISQPFFWSCNQKYGFTLTSTGNMMLWALTFVVLTFSRLKQPCPCDFFFF